MFRVGEQEIMDAPLEVMWRLRTSLLEAGKDLLRGIKPSSSGSNIQFTCPVHNHGQESKPSCGITTQDRGNTPAGTVHCFACGYTASIDSMISRCFGYDDLGRYGRKWLTENFIVAERGNRRDPLRTDFSREVKKEQVTYVSEEELESYRFTHPYVYKRGMTDEVLDLFDVGYDKKTKCVTFPVRDEQGRTLFIARRSVKTKFFNYPADVKKPVYGMDVILKKRAFDTVVVCESFFNALTCWVHGVPAVAMLGLGTETQYEQLRRSPIRKFICAFDPDDKGEKASWKFYNALKTSKIITRYILPSGKDINDLTFEEFEGLEEFYF